MKSHHLKIDIFLVASKIGIDHILNSYLISANCLNYLHSEVFILKFAFTGTSITTSMAMKQHEWVRILECSELVQTYTEMQSRPL